MPTAIVQHKVKDFATWKRAFDSHAGRKSQGFRDRVLQIADDPNNVVVIVESDDASKLTAFLNSGDLQSTMEAAGVIGRPTIYLCK
ncbi:MAG: hypothetical protein ACLQJR_33175 [Stellaceae bacterium]